MPATPTSASQQTTPRRPWRNLLTYAAGSVVATVSSEATLLLCYGVLGLSPALSSVVAWLAGAAPNYWLNRTWTWGRRGRPSLSRELLPYVAIIVVTVLLAALATGAVDRWLRASASSSTTRLVLVGGTFLGVYVVMFALRYVLLNRLFDHLAGADRISTKGSAP